MNITGDSKNQVCANIVTLGATQVRYSDDDTGFAVIGTVKGKRTLIGEAYEKNGAQIVNLTTMAQVDAIDAMTVCN